MNQISLYLSECKISPPKPVLSFKCECENQRLYCTGESVGLIGRHGQHVLGDVDTQLLVQSHLMELFVIFGVVHQHLDLCRDKHCLNYCNLTTEPLK